MAKRSGPGRWPSSSRPGSCSPRSARCPWSCSGTTARRTRSRTAARTSAFPLHQGTVEAGLVTCHWHHARFDLVSGCTLDLWADDARGFDVEVRDDDVFVDRASRRRPDRRTSRRGCATGSRRASRSSSPSRCSGCSTRACPRPRSCAPVSTSARRTATPAGARASPCSSRWRTSSRTSTPTTARSRSCTVSRSSRTTPATSAPRFPVGPLPTRRRARRPARAVVPTLHRHALDATRPNARSRPRSSMRRALADVEAMMFAAVDRSRVHRRRSHDRLHEQGVRGARPLGRGRGAGRCCRRSCRRPRPRNAPRSSRSGATRTISSRSPT